MNNYLITPDSDIYLLKSPLEIDSLNQLDFANATAQHTYFNGLTKLLMDDATYVRKDGRLYFEGSFDTLIGYNYCMYRNTNYSNKWFYAFVTDMRFENNNVVSCNLTTDVFQTWMFEKVMKRSFIERTHVSTSNDVAGAYTYPEDLETGDYICDQISSIDLGSRYYVIGVTKRYDNSWGPGGGIYNGAYSGKTYYATNVSSGIDGMISAYSTGHAEDIAEIFMVPKNLINYGLENGTVDSEVGVTRLAQSVSIEQVASDVIARPSTINGYTPKNKKLLTHPYMYILVDNNAGNTAVYKYELFSNPSNCVLKVLGVLTPGTSMSVLPVAYTNSGANANDGGGVLSTPNMYSNALTLGKYPICNWTTDVYTNWLTQNSVNMQYSIYRSTIMGAVEGLKGGAEVGGVYGAAAGGILGTGAGLFGQVWQNDRQKHEQQFTPNTSQGNANAGDIITCSFANKPSVYKMNIKSEYARIIDDFFTMFGYKINRLGTINTNTRSNWNYIKCIDVNIEGNIPQQDMQRLKALYNNGFTIWHDPATYLDYSQNNT